MKLLTAFFILFTAPFAQALEQDFSFDTLTVYEHGNIEPSVLNPDNKILKLPTDQIWGELRPSSHTRMGNFELQLRPRIYAESDDLDSVNKLYFQEAYAKYSVIPEWQLYLGRQNLGWGPAESVTPSNFLFPLTQLHSASYYEELGLTLFRTNLSIGQNYSLIFADELEPFDDNTSSVETTREKSQDRWLTKLEYSSDNSDFIFGYVGGQNNLKDYDYSGGYFSVTPNDAWQFYADLTSRREKPSKNYLLSVVGTRFTFKSGTEFRLEYIYNQAGMTFSQEKDLVQNASFLIATGALNQSSELLTKDYVYASIRWTDLKWFPRFMRKNMSSLKNFSSVTDSTGILLYSLESGFTNHLTGYLFSGLAYGKAQYEFTKAYNSFFGLGIKYSY